MTHDGCSDLFRLQSPFKDPFRGALFQIFQKPLSSLLCLPRLNSLYSLVHDESHWETKTDFIGKALKLLGVSAALPQEELDRIPESGPSVVVANHPFGVIEGLVLIRLLKAVRPDVKIMANFMLGLIPEMGEHLIWVDPFGGNGSVAGNISGLKEAVKWVKGGGMLAVFPAGEVASLKIRDRKVEDPAWSPTVGGIIRKTGASAVPVYFSGRNSVLFQMMGLVHPGLRTVLLPRENLKKKNSELKFAVGTEIKSSQLEKFKSNREIIEYLRFRTYILKGRFSKGNKGLVEGLGKKEKPVSESVRPDQVVSEFESLRPEAKIAESGDFQIWEVHASECPYILRELGRLREKTFRTVGEGTGAQVDIDRFDNTFVHLVLWNSAAKEIAGAYRLGRTDDILEKFGLRGVYSNSFFRFDKEFFDKVTPAIELGRSFIRPRYQKNYASLMMLWKGIAGYISKNPKYRYLFGCVSISAEYSRISREIIAESLLSHRGRADLTDMISPARPLKLKKMKYWKSTIASDVFSNPADMDMVVQDVEGGAGIPVLLRHYLKVGGRLVGFNVDPDFNNSLDGLIVVDLLETSKRSLAKFMGRENAAAFLRYHLEEEEQNKLAV
ncbi:GNAT family N-acyltransferase [Maridesulfovibrio bastinii]|uniref:GNAT family N-acyltransferase n=1 Tax=Maridesulfovibrio bastinii TaxID=47157 RepID=UPI000425C72D|nr:GNAT family N-acyltransferase [Maridesulfovibrio bastinii]